MRRLPISTASDNIDVKSVFGQSLFGMYHQIVRLLSAEPRTTALQHFFAEPAVNKTDGSINWYTKAEGPIRCWDELTLSEQTTAIATVNSNCQLISSFCEQLIRSQGPSSPTVEALKSMLINPNITQSLCMVGQHLVITQWGCRPFGTSESDFSLEVQGERAKQFVIPQPAFNNNGSSDSEVINDSGSNAPPSLSVGQIPPTTPSSVATDLISEPELEPVAETEPETEPKTEPEPEPQSPRRSIRDLLWRWVIILTLLALFFIGVLLKGCTTSAIHTASIDQREFGEMADLVLAADEKLLQCRPQTDGAAGTQNQRGVLLDPNALAKKEINVFTGRWVLHPETKLTIDKQTIAWEITFDNIGNGRTYIKTSDGTVCKGTAQVSIEASDRFRMPLSNLECIGSFNGVNSNLAVCQVLDGGRIANCEISCVHGPCDARFQRY